MITITVCVGSSCHIRGAREIIQIYSDLIKREKIEEHVALKGSFCMEKCTEGVNLQIGEEHVRVSSPEAAEEIFRQKVLAVIREKGQQA